MMKKTIAALLWILSIFTCGYIYASHQANTIQEKKFHTFINSVKQEAKKHGVSQQTINEYLNPLTPPTIANQQHIQRHQKQQLQKVLTFQQYMQRFLSKTRIEKGRLHLHQQQQLLQKIYQAFGVPPAIIIAIWGVESDYGSSIGGSMIVHSLANLAFNHHRSKFYRRQLIYALVILDKHYHIPEQQRSTWDGGMGQPQFEPKEYIDYAVDFDNNGFKNIWTNVPDSLASIANYLKQNGWHKDKPWGLPVTLPKLLHSRFAAAARNQTLRLHFKPIHYWQALGIKTTDGKTLSGNLPNATLLFPDKNTNGTVYLVFHNFEVLTRWNHTIFESLAIGELAKRI